MKILKSILFISFFLLVFPSVGQQGFLRGTVVDSKTFKPLTFASVYINNTTIGSSTDLQGDYLLSNIPIGDYELIVSYIGYQPYHIRVTVLRDQIQNLSVKLTPAITNLLDVKINSSKDEKWKSQLKRFQNLFFGNSQWTKLCTIYNPWVLEFSEGKNDQLIAIASAPLEIENPGLGYRITYQLKEFSAGPTAYRISGYVKFKEIATRDTVLSALWSTRRTQIYYGSSRHLFKAMINNRSVEEGFLLLEDKSGLPEIIRKSNYLANLNQSVFTYSDSGKVTPLPRPTKYKIQLPSRLEVHYLKRSVPPTVYRNVTSPISWVEVKGGAIEASSEGIVNNPGALILSGAMGEARVAQVLPNDYLPPAEENEEPKLEPRSPLASIIEKPYIQTDKGYYYSDDMIFFKVYMNYTNPLIRDSLSHVLYVELIDTANQVRLRKVLLIEDGMTDGNFVLAPRIEAGSYALRAYTRLMLNFDRRLIYVKPITILNPSVLVRNTTSQSADHDRVSILVAAKEFRTREKIPVKFEVSDAFDFPIAANVSVSITDVGQVSPLQNEPGIVSEFSINEKYLPDTAMKRIEQSIQYGIEFKGRMIYKRKKDAPGIITVFQKEAKDVFAMPTELNGAFIHPLQFLNSAEFYVYAKTLKGRFRKVAMDTMQLTSPRTSFQPQILETYSPSDPAKYHVNSTYFTLKMLDEVIVEGKRIERSNNTKHLQSDFKIDGEWLRSTNATDLLSAIQSRVPGLKILYYFDGGFIKKFLVFNGPNSFGASQECLVEVDNIVLVPLDGQSVADQLAFMSVSEIESIEVLKYGSGAIYGARGANGIIVVKTRTGNKEGAQVKRNYNMKKMALVKLSGYTESKQFDAPDYSVNSSNDDQFDGRSTIYWNPKISTDGKSSTEVSFYAADILSTYRIVVEGLDAMGNPVRGEKYIRTFR